MNLNVKLLMIPFPKKLPIESPPGKKEDGINLNSGIAVKDLTPAQAQQYADWMRNEFLEHWNKEVGVLENG